MPKKTKHSPQHIEFIRNRNRSEEQRNKVRAYWTPEKRAKKSSQMRRLWARIKAEG